VWFLGEVECLREYLYYFECIVLREGVNYKNFGIIGNVAHFKLFFIFIDQIGGGLSIF
jgi:hypothetical protein